MGCFVAQEDLIYLKGVAHISQGQVTFIRALASRWTVHLASAFLGGITGLGPLSGKEETQPLKLHGVVFQMIISSTKNRQFFLSQNHRWDFFHGGFTFHFPIWIRLIKNNKYTQQTKASSGFFFSLSVSGQAVSV